MASYYRYIDGLAYDRQLLEKAESLISGAGDGRISEVDIQALYDEAMDAGKLTNVEKRTLHYIAEHFRLTEKALQWLQENLPFSNDFEAGIRSIIQDELGFPGMRWVIDAEEVSRQSAFDNQQSFETALKEAVLAILNEAESSTSLRDVIYMETGADLEDVAGMKLLAREWMDEGILYFIPLDWENQAEQGTFSFEMPFYEPDLNEFWVFGLEIPSRTQYLFTASVRRNGFEQSFSAGHLPENRTSAEWADRIILEEFQLDGMRYFFDEQEIEAQQELGGAVDKFPDALRQGLVAFIHDTETPENLAYLVSQVFLEEINPNDFDFPGDYWMAVQARVLELLREGLLYLLPTDILELSEDEIGDLSVPHDGETVQDNWIFMLRLPNFSDHVHWAVVDRSGIKRAYNYGFN